MATGVNELLDMLYDSIAEAKRVPFSADKCTVERDKTLELIDDIRDSFPVELAEAKKLLAARSDYLASAKREADLVLRQAEERAKQMLAEDELLAQAKQRGTEMLRKAEERSRELKRAANDYCEDALRRTEEAVAEAYDEIKKSRGRFRAAAAGINGGSAPTGQAQVYDAAADEN